MVYVDCAGERSGRKLARGDGGEDLADRVHHILADVRRCEEVINYIQTKGVKHSGKEDISKMNDSK